MEYAGTCDAYDSLDEEFSEPEKYMRGTSLYGYSEIPTIDFSVRFRDDKEFIYERFMREIRNGFVIRTRKNTATFCARVYDAQEMLGLIRIFKKIFCRREICA